MRHRATAHRRNHALMHNAHLQSVAVSLATYQQVDPSHTLTLRNAFASEMRRRFRELTGAIRRAIVDEDVFGLMETSVARVRPLAMIAAYQLRTPGPRAFAFNTSQQKVGAFMAWLNEQIENGILEASLIPQPGAALQPQWTDTFIQSAYQQGIRNGHLELIKAGWEIPTIDALGGLDAIFNQPFHADRVGILFTRTFSDLRGITAQMESQISRVLAQSMAEGRGAREIARLLNRTITGPVGDLALTDTLGRFIPAQRRAVQLARTEIIRAHSEAQLQEYENWGVVGVTALAEFRSAGDARVCIQCLELEKTGGRGDGVFTIQQARGVIPVHVS